MSGYSSVAMNEASGPGAALLLLGPTHVFTALDGASSLKETIRRVLRPLRNGYAGASSVFPGAGRARFRGTDHGGGPSQSLERARQDYLRRKESAPRGCPTLAFEPV